MAEDSKTRLMSLDALRGFDMFWIIGGAGLVSALARVCGLPEGWTETLDLQFTHVTWEGFRFFDLIFPLFVFLSGVAVPFSVLSKRGRGDSVAKLQFGIVKRSLVLVAIGLSFSVFRFDPSMVRLYTVLYLIGMAYMIGASLALHITRIRRLFITGILILVGYHLAMMFLPYPGREAGLTPENNLAAWIDRNLIPTNLYRTVYDPEGTIRVIPAGVLCLFGVIAGLRIKANAKPSWRCAGELAAAGLIALIAGWLWSFSFPIIKDLWSPSFILWSAGWALLLLAIFYGVIDVLGLRWMGFFFVPIGMNAIVIYASQWYVPWGGIRDFFFSGFAGTMGSDDWKQLVMSGGLLAVQWALLFWMHRQRIHVRV